jgi:hypothetical protein
MSQTKHLPVASLVFAILFLVSADARAAISVGASGSSGILTFGTQPPATEFATYVLTGGGATYVDPAAMDAGVQTLDAATIVNQLTAIAQATPGTYAGGMRWNSQTFYLQSRPTTSGTNAAGVMKATLQNDSGGDLTEVTISYDYGLFNDVDEEVPGFRVFWSLTGTPGSWNLLSTLSGNETVGNHSESMGAVVWPAGSTLYILWADDNDDGASDQGQTIDNFVVSGISTTVTPIVITDDPDSITVPERGTATFTVVASGSPQGFHWLRNGSPIIGANSSTYIIPSVASPGDDGAMFSVIVSNALGPVTSATATLTVLPDTNPPVALSAVSSIDRTTVTITFSEVVVSFDPSNFQYFPDGTDPDVTGVTADTFTVVNGSNIVVTFTTSPLADGVNYSLRIFDVFDTAANPPGGNLIDPYPSIIPLRRTLELIGFDVNNEWRWSTETNLFGTGWETVGYDDSDGTGVWFAGPAALGVNTDANANAVPIRTPTAYAANSAPQFFRRHFFLPAGVSGTTLSIRHLFEDGAVVFINGQEAGRYNVGEGALSVTTRATVNFAENSPLPAPTPLPTTNVVAGDNVIAVVVFQNGGTSSDSIMALELTANIGEFANGPAEIVTQPQSQSVSEGANVSFSVVADGELPLYYQWRRNGSSIMNATNASYSILGVLPSQAGDYDVIVTNNVSSTNSAVATLTVTADTISPVFVSAVGSTNLTNIILTITDAFGLNVANAEDEANYSVHLTAGGGSLTIESAVLVNSSNVLLATSARTQSQNYTVDLSNIRDRSEAQNLVTPLSRPLLGGIVILAPNDTTLWRFDAASNNLDGVSWQLTGFDDSLWLTGLAGFTTSNNLELTASGFEVRTTNMLAPNTGGPVTAYYRVPFNFPGSVANAQLHIVGVVDDGMVAYINGVEAGRLRVTNSPVSFNDLATAASPETADLHATESVQLDTTALVAGNNLLAIELHQNSTGSSDAVLSIQLVAEIAEFSPVGPTLNIANSGGNITISWQGGGTLQYSLDISSSANWQNIPGAVSPFQTNAASAVYQFFRVTIP